jgi:hypothetical protein
MFIFLYFFLPILLFVAAVAVTVVAHTPGFCWVLFFLPNSVPYLQHCHKHEALRDEVYCQLMKQTTNNKSMKPDSCQRGWRLFSIVAAYFVCSETLKPYLFKYLETAAYDKRRAYHGKNVLCLNDLIFFWCSPEIVQFHLYLQILLFKRTL